MTPSLFLIQLAILFLPGVIWAHLDARFAMKTDPSQTEFLVRSFVFGLTSYVLTYLIYLAKGWTFAYVDLSKIDTTVVLTKELGRQVLTATLVGFGASIAWMYGVRFKLLTRFLQRIGATRTYGDEDVWDFILNSEDVASQYVNIRDFEKKLTYSGFVRTFSQTGKLREIVLSEVQIYDFEGSLFFTTPRIYLSFKAEGAHIEFPYNGEPQKEET